MTEKTSAFKNVINQIIATVKSICKTIKKLAYNVVHKIPAEQKQKISHACTNFIHSFETHIKYDLSKIQNGNFNYCKGKFFGMLIGIIFFAMPGLFVGLIVGHFFDLSQKSDDFKKFVADNKKAEKISPAQLENKSSDKGN